MILSLMELLSDGRIILGIGIGLTIASMFLIFSPAKKVSESQIIQMAKDRGMVFKDEVKALYNQ